MSTKQEIKCPHCSKSFPIQEGFKHQAEELRKKLETEEKQKSAIRQKEIEEAYKAKVLKQDKEHQAQLVKIEQEATIKQKKEAEKLAAVQVKKFKETVDQQSKKIKDEAEAKAKRDQTDKEALKEEMVKIKKAHQIDLDRVRTNA